MNIKRDLSNAESVDLIVSKRVRDFGSRLFFVALIGLGATSCGITIDESSVHNERGLGQAGEKAPPVESDPARKQEITSLPLLGPLTCTLPLAGAVETVWGYGSDESYNNAFMRADGQKNFKLILRRNQCYSEGGRFDNAFRSRSVDFKVSWGWGVHIGVDVICCKSILFPRMPTPRTMPPPPKPTPQPMPSPRTTMPVR